MKKVLILFGRKKWNKNCFEMAETKLYQHCYEYLYDLARKEGVEMFRASYAWYDFKNKRFKHAWTFNKGKWRRVRNIKPDLIYDKTKFTAESHYFKQNVSGDYKIINENEFTLILDNKFLTSIIFPNFSKKHYRIKSRKDLYEASRKIKGDKIVLKTSNGSCGKGVKIIKKSELESVKIIPDLTTQEFIDSSKGVKGLVPGYHDLRLVFINNHLIYAYFRIPAKGSFLANLSQGGSMLAIEKKDVPKSVKPIIDEVQEVFQSYYPKIYTIDIMFDEKQRPWIVELNSMPGMYFSPEQNKWQNEMYLKLVRIFKKETRS